MQTYDIAIVGGGIAGLSLAYFLGKDRSIVVLEGESQLGYHSTGRSAAEFVLRYNSPEVCALAEVSHAFFRTPPDGFCSVPLLTPRGGITLAGPDKAERLQCQFEAERRQSESIRLLDRDEALAMVPILNPDRIGGAFFDPDFWDIDVDALLQAYLRGARRAGVVIRERAKVIAARADEQGWRIETEGGDILAGILVNASGAWADDLARRSGVTPLGIVPHRRTAILVDLPEAIDGSGMPEVNELDEDFYFKPDAGRLMVSPADETPCDACDAQPEEIDIAWAAHHLEEATTLAVRRIAKSWAGLRSFAADRLPVVGFDRDNPRFFWLAGQGGYGILSSPALARIAASQIAGAPLSEDFHRAGLAVGQFSPSRLPA